MTQPRDPADLNPAALGLPHEYSSAADTPTNYRRRPGEEIIEISYTTGDRRTGVLISITPEELAAFTGALPTEHDEQDLRFYRFTQALSMFCKVTGLKVYG